MQLGGALTVWFIPFILVAGVIGVEWKQKHPDVHIADFVRADSFTLGLLVLCALIWIVPLGWLLALPASAIGLGIRSIASDDARAMWKERWGPRGMLVISIVVGMLISGIGSVSEPVGASEWGQPLRTDNPDAPFWPASEQHTWLLTDGTIIVVNHVRLPGTLSPIGSANTVQWWLEVSNTDEERLKIAIETLLVEIHRPASDAEYFSLETVASGQTHDYGGTVLPYTHKYIILDLFSEFKAAEMITVAQGEWGGEIKLITVIKPSLIGLNPPFFDDPWAAQYVEPWLDANA
jgi:hypothetical protein